MPKGLLLDSYVFRCSLYITSLSVVGFGPATQERTEGERSKTPLWGRYICRKAGVAGQRASLRPLWGA